MKKASPKKLTLRRETVQLISLPNNEAKKMLGQGAIPTIIIQTTFPSLCDTE